MHRAEADLGYGVAHDVTLEGGVIGRVLCDSTGANGSGFGSGRSSKGCCTNGPVFGQ